MRAEDIMKNTTLRSPCQLLLLLAMAMRRSSYHAQALDIVPIPSGEFLEAIFVESVSVASSAVEEATTTTDSEHPPLTTSDADGEVETTSIHWLGTPPIPEVIRDALPTDGAFDQILQLTACTDDREVPDDYNPPFTSEELMDTYFEDNVPGGVEGALEAYTYRKCVTVAL